MAEFVIRLSDERGHVREQIESAPSEAELRERLLQQGLVVMGVRSQDAALGRTGVSGKRKIRLGQFVAFNQQLLTLIRAGLPILTGLDLLVKQQKDDALGGLLRGVRERVNSGQLLSEAFDVPGVFPKMYTTTLLAGEKSGNLEEVLGRYVHFQRLSLSFRKKLTASLIYPALLVGMVLVMLTFLVTFVVPQFADLYDQLGAELPAATQFMLALGLNVRHYFLLIIAGLAVLATGLWQWTHSKNGARQLDRLRLALPLAGPIWLKYQVSMFSRMMSTLLAGGLPLVPALRTAGASLQSREMAAAVTDAVHQVCEGQTLARSLQQSQRFPELSVEMIEVGESTGALPAMLTSVAEYYEEDVETALAAALSLIEPAILIVMAIIVGVVLISLYLPIFQLGAGKMIH